MTRKTLRIVLAAATLLFGAAHVPAQADTGFKALAGIEAEPMNAQEMDAVQGKAFVNAFAATVWERPYLFWQDDEFSFPFVFDLHLPGVQQALAWGVAGALGADPNSLFRYLLQADPSAAGRHFPFITPYLPQNPSLTEYGLNGRW